MKRILYIILIFSACDPGEIPINPPTSELLIETIPLEPNYQNQVFYDLSQSSISSINTKSEWDIGILLDSNFKIILNSANFSKVWVTDYNFNDSVYIANAQWSWDAPSGNHDSLAFQSIDTSKVYILDRGLNINGSSMGMYKVQFLELNTSFLRVKTSQIEVFNDTILNITLDQNKLFTPFSFSSLKVVNISPEINNWDLLFTQYTRLFTNPQIEYLVTGVLINDKTTQVAVDTINDFNQINYSSLSDYQFLSQRDIIGYNWKEFNFETNLYSVKDNINFVIRDFEGKYYKMRFIDFYNNQGLKGYPKFELEELIP